MVKCELLLIDFDGVLSKGESFTPEEVLEAKPIQENIELVNELHKNNFIVIWTARRDHLIPASLKWLRQHGVEFDAISNKKPAASYYVDDKIATLKELVDKEDTIKDLKEKIKNKAKGDL